MTIYDIIILSIKIMENPFARNSAGFIMKKLARGRSKVILLCDMASGKLTEGWLIYCPGC